MIKNQFINSLSVDSKGNLFFLNSFGSLYSIDINTLNINWFIILINHLIYPHQIYLLEVSINNNDKYVIVSSNTNTFIIEINTGSIVKSLTSHLY